MATLLVRNLDDEVVDALRKRAERHGRSVEEEHRRLLRRALLPKRARTLLDAIRSFPYFEEDDELLEMPRKIEPMRDPFEDG